MLGNLHGAGGEQQGGAGLSLLAHAAQRATCLLQAGESPDLGKSCRRRWASMGVVGPCGPGRPLFRILFMMVQPPGPPPCPCSTAGSPGPHWGPGCFPPHANLPAFSLDQDKPELELVLKGSYEDTQTLALGTASAFCFHYIAAQETELIGHLRVGLASRRLPRIPAFGQLQPLWASPWPSPHPESPSPLWPCQPLPVGHCTLSTQGDHQGAGWARGLLCHVSLCWSLPGDLPMMPLE